MRKEWYQDHSRGLKLAKKDGQTEKFVKDFQEDLATRSVEDISIRSLFESFVEDGKQLVEEFDPRYGGEDITLMEAGGNSGAVSTTDFSNITGQIFYNAGMREFEEGGYIHPSLMDNQPTRLSGEKVVGIGNFGDETDTVQENGDYPRVKLAEEWIRTPETVKRGAIVDVSKEAVFFDRTGDLLRKAQAMARMLWMNKEKRCLDLALGVTNSYSYMGTSYDTYQASTPWINSHSNTLTNYTDIENAILLWDAMTDPITGEPIMPGGMQLVVPSALLMTARSIINATEVTRGDNQANADTLNRSFTNPLSGMGINVVSNQYVKSRTSSASTWFLGDFKKAFKYMENWPFRVERAPASYNAMYERDCVASYKCSEMGVPSVWEPRYVTKNT